MWRATIEKYYALAGEYWTNVYMLDVANGNDAQAAADALVTAERQFHLTSVLFTKARVDDNTPNTDVYDTWSINQYGTLDQTADPMPLFVALRVDLNTAGGGRPSRKYYRGVLTEAHITTMQVAQNIRDLVKNTLNPVIAGSAYVDVDGQKLINAEPSPIVGMRQLRRGSKKKNTP